MNNQNNINNNVNNNVDLPKLVENKVDNIEQKIEKVVEENEASLKGLFKYITTRDIKDLFLLLIRLVIIALIIIVFHLPFSLFKDLGVSFLTLFNINITNTILNIWYFICEGIYAIVAIIAFYKIVITRYDNLLKKEKIEIKAI